MIVNLRDRKILPSFHEAPHEYDLDEDIYINNNGYARPRRHWCLLAEIEEAEFVFRLRLIVRDIEGYVFPIGFYLKDVDDPHGAPLDLSQFEKGNTVAIMYAHQHPFLDMTEGIRQEHSKTFKVLPISMASMLRLNDELHQKLASDGDKTCHTCSQKLDKPKKCGNCGLAEYCTKECQTKAWHDTHKHDCKMLKQLRGFFKFDWYQFDGFETVPT